MTRFIGLTGGIATGKSTVSALLVAKGARLIDADQVARAVVEPGQPALLDIARRFPGTVDAQGRLDRQQLSERIFSSPADREALNAITHPRIQAAFLEQSQALAAQGVPVVLYDAALLIENRLHEAMDGVVLVVAPPEVQRQRLMQRNHLSAEQAQARIASQMPLEDKRPFATWVIDNGGSLEATRAQVEALWPLLLG